MSIHDYLLQKVNYYFPDWRQRVQEGRAAINKWGRDLRLSLSKLIALFVITGGAYAVILIYVRSFWLTYQNTSVGQSFLKENASSIFVDSFLMLEGNLFLLSFGLCVDVLVAGLLVGLVGQFLALRRYFYYGRGIPGHIVWSAAIAVLATFEVLHGPTFSSINGILFLIIPSLCLHDRCLKLTSTLVPEFFIVFKLKQWRKIRKVAKIRNMDRNAGSV